MMSVFAPWTGFLTALPDPDLEGSKKNLILARNIVSKEPNSEISFCRVFSGPGSGMGNRSPPPR
jgi:hypothetical protein